LNFDSENITLPARTEDSRSSISANLQFVSSFSSKDENVILHYEGIVFLNPKGLKLEYCKELEKQDYHRKTYGDSGKKYVEIVGFHKMTDAIINIAPLV